MLKRISVLLSFLCLSMGFTKAEINVGNSVEWLCADAGFIASGTLTSYVKCSTSNNTWICTFQIFAKLKGTTESPVYFSLNYLPEDSLKKYQSEKTPLLVFLKENEKPFKFNKITANWFAMEAYNGIPALINLKTPPLILISAQGFFALESGETILSYCTMTITKIAEYEAKPKNVFQNYLEIPYQSTAFKLLYQESSCYLSVPDFMFPESKAKLY